MLLKKPLGHRILSPCFVSPLQNRYPLKAQKEKTKKLSLERDWRPDSVWRRRRDLNPRAGFPTYSLSRGAPSPLGYFSIGEYIKNINDWLAERKRFELLVPCGITGFQDQLHKPLGHLSISHERETYSTIFLKGMSSTLQKNSDFSGLFGK